MTILEGDIKLLASRVMDDVPEGGGGPTGTVIPYGGSNHIFSDITEVDRAGGNVSIRQVHAAVMTSTPEQYQGANFILSMPPTDPNVSVTLAKCNLFARRTEIAAAIANYLIQGSEWSGYLLENHVQGQRSIQLFHRPGTPTPNIGRTLVLIYNENEPGQLIQYVRVTKVTTETRTFTYNVGGGYVDYQASVSQLDLSDALRYNFPGSPPDRSFGRDLTNTLIRDTTVADAAVYYGASPLAVAGAIGDRSVKVATIYTQLVPNSRTETISLDQRPAAQRTLTLATSPREVSIGAAPHTTRIKVGQENRGFSWVNIIKPFPAPNSLVISYMALGVWYTVTDDGAGALTGAGAGTVNYANGTVALTLSALPDIGSAIIFNWGEKSAFVNRSGQAGFRDPEFAWVTPHAPLKPGSVVVTWLSGGVLKTATDNGTGGFAAGASGEIDYASGKIFLRPASMIDAGGEFSTAYEYTSSVTQNFGGVAVDAGGFATLNLDEVPAARSITVRWITVRNVSSSSGVSEMVSSSSTAATPAVISVGTPAAVGNSVIVSPGEYVIPGNKLTLLVNIVSPQVPGTYTWELVAAGSASAALILADGSTSGAFEADYTETTDRGFRGVFELTIDVDCPDMQFTVTIKNQALTAIAVTNVITVDAVGDVPAPAFPAVIKPPASVTPVPLATQTGLAFPSAKSLSVLGMFPGGVDKNGKVVYVSVAPYFDTEDFAGYYNPPASTTEVWTDDELINGKQLDDVEGWVPKRTFKVWGQT